jgi:hypothetical protein
LAFSVMGPMSSRFSKLAVWAQRAFNRLTSNVNLPISPRNTSLSNSISCHNRSKKKKTALFELVCKEIKNGNQFKGSNLNLQFKFQGFNFMGPKYVDCVQ